LRCDARKGKSSRRGSIAAGSEGVASGRGEVVADEYLRDPNITSVGIGYEVVGGERTKELAF